MKNEMNAGNRIMALTSAGIAACCLATAPQLPAADLTSDEAKTIAIEAYLYAYPLVTMDLTRRQMTNLPSGVKPGFGPPNMFHHARSYPAGDSRDIVRPNFDTLYSFAWLDLTQEPMIISTPDSGGRYFLVPLYDMWNEAYAAPGKRTSGTAAAHFAVVPPGWSGTLPSGVGRIDSPTPYTWAVGRTQTNGPSDYAAVNGFQDGFALTPLSRWGKPAAPPPAAAPDPAVDMDTPLVQQIGAMTGDEYFAYAAELMKLHKPHLTDWSMVERMKRLGIVPGQSFDFAKSDAITRQALLEAPAAAQQAMKEATPSLVKRVNGWQIFSTAGVYGNAYLARAVLSALGVGANQIEDSIYPVAAADADGQPLDGSHDYVLHFAKAELPPVVAFWSITMYDADGYQVPNPLDRFAIGDRDALKYNPDGSLDLYFQNASPGKDKESNWLPVPKGPLGIVMRLYAPKPEALDGRWALPAIRKVR